METTFPLGVAEAGARLKMAAQGNGGSRCSNEKRLPGSRFQNFPDGPEKPAEFWLPVWRGGRFVSR